MSPTGVLMAAGFVFTSCLVLLVYLLATGRRSRLQTRLEDLAGNAAPSAAAELTVGQLAREALPRVGAALPVSEEERSRLQARLIHAGYYAREAVPVFLGAKLVLALVLIVAGLSLGLTGRVTLTTATLIAAMLGAVGLIVPSFWLDHRKKARQVLFRRALPDALDVLVICLEGGASVPAGLQRVAHELRGVYPALAAELSIVLREVQMGRSVGEALRQMADRLELEEIRNLAAVVQQSERFGASLVKALRVHAETLRIRRLQHAEEMAQKAAVKILIPTILFIFPAMFIVVLGPPVVEVLRMLRGVGH